MLSRDSAHIAGPEVEGRWLHQLILTKPWGSVPPAVKGMRRSLLSYHRCLWLSWAIIVWRD
jgi:hypothetical protein